MARRMIATISLGFGVGALAAILLLPGALDRVLGEREPVTIGEALIGGPFSLIDQAGRTVTELDFRDRHLLVFFGYTQSPDDTPAGLQTMAGALNGLGAKAGKVAAIFITLDPERDAPAVIAKYIAGFHAGIVGLTGSPQATIAAAKAYRVYARRLTDETAPGGYTIDHSTYIYLMGPSSKYITHFPPGTAPGVIAAELVKRI